MHSADSRCWLGLRCRSPVCAYPRISSQPASVRPVNSRRGGNDRCCCRRGPRGCRAVRSVLPRRPTRHKRVKIPSAQRSPIRRVTCVVRAKAQVRRVLTGLRGRWLGCGQPLRSTTDPTMCALQRTGRRPPTDSGPEPAGHDGCQARTSVLRTPSTATGDRPEGVGGGIRAPSRQRSGPSAASGRSTGPKGARIHSRDTATGAGRFIWWQQPRPSRPVRSLPCRPRAVAVPLLPRASGARARPPA